MNKQRGFSFFTVVILVAGIVFAAVIAMKLWPAYNEYFAVKKAFTQLKTKLSASELSKNDIVTTFDNQAVIDDIKHVTGKDLVIEDTDKGTVVSAEYSVVEPLMGNVSALITFQVSTDDSATKADAAAAAE
jgi:hypothetical protein